MADHIVKEYPCRKDLPHRQTTCGLSGEKETGEKDFCLIRTGVIHVKYTKYINQMNCILPKAPSIDADQQISPAIAAKYNKVTTRLLYRS